MERMVAMTTGLYSALHFLVDCCCAFAMFGSFSGGAAGYGNILIYNFCAFALQMPLGAALDCFTEDKPRAPAICAGAGVALTLLGLFTHPAILGLGNAAFHVGGGIDVIRVDQQENRQGRLLGIFVAPGALGLYLGGQIAGVVNITFPLILLSALPVALLFRQKPPELPKSSEGGRADFLLPGLCCFLVVILRSYVGLSVVFPWKSGFFPGLIAVCAVVLGKIAGGFAAARFGSRNTAVVTLVLSALCFRLGDLPVFGVLALFCFNMTMPLTLYQLWLRQPNYPGTCFGVLTFGLFLGFLPVHLGWNIPIGGVLGSLLSLGLLIPVVWRKAEWT